MLMDVVTDFPERLQPGSQVFLGSTHKAGTIASCRPDARGLLIRLEQIDSPEAAGALRSQLVYVLAADRPPLPAGHYYHHQLLGMRVFDEHEQSLGELDEILQTGANDVFVVKTSRGGELLLPTIGGVILKVDVDQGRIVVKPPNGLEAEVKRQPAGRRHQDGRHIDGR
jgi:16S rRNA processing protein RimM